MLLIAAPGQGAQAPGFLTEWLDMPGISGRLGAWSDLAGCDLVKFADLTPTLDECEQALVVAEKMVRMTMPARAFVEPGQPGGEGT